MFSEGIISFVVEMVRIVRLRNNLEKLANIVYQACMSMNMWMGMLKLCISLGHELGVSEFPFLPLPESTKQDTALKVTQGIPPQRIMDGKV